MVEAVFVLVFCICLFVFGFFLGVLTLDKDYVKYYNLYVEEKIHSQELFLKCREKISREDFEEIKEFHISHLTKGMEDEDGRD